MKKILALLCLIVFTFTAFACSKQKSPVTITENDTYVAIIASNEHVKITNSTSLLEYMYVLKSKEFLTFETSGTMLTSMNGMNNASNNSLCWMLYTNDEENSNSMWGEVVYKGITCSSATQGVADLIIKEGYLYLWVFTELDVAR